MKILIVDDNKNWVFIVRMMLEEEGFEVQSASDGETGYSIYLSFNGCSPLFFYNYLKSLHL